MNMKNLMAIFILVTALCVSGTVLAGNEYNTPKLKMTGMWQSSTEISTPNLKMTGLGPEWQLKKITTYPLEMTGTAGQTSIQTFNIGNLAGIYKVKKSETRATPAERTQENISQSDIAKRNRAANRRGVPSGFSEEEEGSQIQ